MSSLSLARSEQPADALTVAHELLAFKVGNEEYGVDIQQVQEIRSYERPTTIANASPELKGVMNLRGVIVPIIDLRLKMGTEQAHYGPLTVVIVLHLGHQVVGVVVDGVSDVVTLEPEQLQPVPRLEHQAHTDHLLAIGSIGKRMLILLDIKKYLGPSLLSPNSQ